jgi:transposase
MASVIKERRVIEMIDARLVPDAQEESTPGEAMAGMLLKGLGCGNRPLSLTPQFFANQPLDRGFREGVHAELFNRFHLGRTLAEVSADGGARWVRERALAVCVQAGIDQRFNHRDMTRGSLSGDAVPERDAQAMHLTDGDAKGHRPDLKQAGLALRVSPDGGVPLVSQSWDGNASDTKIVQERAEALIATVHSSPTPRTLVADSKLYPADKAANLNQRGCMTRLPHTRTVVSQVVTHARNGDTWERLDDTTRDHRIELCHYGMAQRWRVVSSQAALERAEATVSHACQRDAAALKTPLFHLHAHRFETPNAANAALAALAQPWTAHQVEVYNLIEPQHDAHPGRPRPTPPIPAMDGQLHAPSRADHQQMASHKHQKACFVVGSTREVSQWSALEVIAADTGQAQAAGGLRFLTDPLLFVSALLVKKPCRIQGLLLVLPWALLVYSVTQRRVRHQWARQGETVPNQIHHPTARPTLRWVFHLLEAIHRGRGTVPGQIHDLIEGLNEGPLQLRRVFGEEVCRRYQISPA